MSTMSPSFTTVPPEIRLMIFEYCLVVVGDIVPYPSDAEREDMAMNVRYKKPAVALLQVNRKIGEEARAVLYGKNTWHLSYQTYPPLQDTVWRINLPLFRHITTSFDYCDVTDFTISALYHGIERETYCALQSGDSSSRMAGNVQRQVTTAATGAMLHCCGYKLYIIDCMSLRSVTIDVEYLMHPTTYERARILRLVRMIPSNIWLTFGEGSGEAPVETPQLVDPNAIPAEATLLRWTGGWEGDAEILADMDG